MKEYNIVGVKMYGPSKGARSGCFGFNGEVCYFKDYNEYKVGDVVIIYQGKQDYSIGKIIFICIDGEPGDNYFQYGEVVGKADITGYIERQNELDNKIKNDENLFMQCDEDMLIEMDKVLASSANAEYYPIFKPYCDTYKKRYGEDWWKICEEHWYKAYDVKVGNK